MEKATIAAGPLEAFVRRALRSIRYMYGWAFVRPRRWFFWQMVRNTYPVWLPRREWHGWELPNIHWWVLGQTVFRFFKWLHWDAWCAFCTYENGWLKHKPLIAKIIHRIGKTTAGFAISGGECFHCASEEGCQVDLSQDDTGKTFRLIETWSIGTMDGTDHRFRGITICPCCGYEAEYEDGSL